MKKLVNGPMRADRFTARVEAVRLGLAENGIIASSTVGARNYVRDQRNALLALLTDVDSTFTVESNIQNGAASDAVIRLNGQGPLEMQALRINGEMTVQWYLADRWYAGIPLRSPTASLTVTPVNAAGLDLASPRTFNVTSSPPLLADSRKVVINEIHANPRVPGAAFVELYNPSTSQSVDLSGMHLVGAGTYEFPSNFALAPQQYLVFCSAYDAYLAEFGRSSNPAGLLPAAPDPAGGTMDSSNPPGAPTPR